MSNKNKKNLKTYNIEYLNDITQKFTCEDLPPFEFLPPLENIWFHHPVVIMYS